MHHFEMYICSLAHIFMPTESRKSFVGVNTYHFILFYIKDSSAQNKGCPGHSIIHVTAVLYHKFTCIGIKYFEL